MALGIDELMSLEEALKPELNEHLTEILSRLNRTDRLRDFLDLIGQSSLLMEPDNGFASSKSGLIVVLGDSQIKEAKMRGILKELGIGKDRLECHLGYAEATSFPYRKLKYSPRYSLVLVGPMPHKAANIGEYSSAIAMMEQEPGFPHVIRMGKNELKITRTGFQLAIEQALKTGWIVADEYDG